jgi:anti-sigma B factor antagonist
MLTVEIEDRNDAVVLHCAGRIVRGEETALLCAASRHRGRSLVVDLAGVEAIDAAGIGALVSLQAAGIYLTLANAGERVREVLRVTQVDTILELLPAPHRETGDLLGPGELRVPLPA